MRAVLRTVCTFGLLVSAWASDDSCDFDATVFLLQIGKPKKKENLLQIGNVLNAGDQETWPNPAEPDLQPTPMQVRMIQGLKAHPDNIAVVNATISSIALTPVWYVVEQGGYDILFRALHDFEDDPTVQMNAWRGLSDQSHTEIGSNLIHNYGGPNEGMKYMVEQLIAHPDAGLAATADHLTLKYEILQCINGLLQWDVNGTRGEAAVEAGLLPAVIHTMQVEGGWRSATDTACGTMCALLTQNASYAEPLLELGAVELINDAIAKYSADDPTPFMFGETLGSSYPVVPSCTCALAVLQSES